MCPQNPRSDTQLHTLHPDRGITHEYHTTLPSCSPGLLVAPIKCLDGSTTCPDSPAEQLHHAHTQTIPI